MHLFTFYTHALFKLCIQSIMLIMITFSICNASSTAYVMPFVGDGTTSLLDFPEDMAQDAYGNIYVADWNKHKILKITPDGIVSTFAGTGTAGYVNHGTATSAQFKNPSGLAFDPSGNLYVADANNHCIRKIIVANGNAGAVSTVFGTGNPGYKNDVSTNAQFNTPVNIRIYNNYFYVTDFANHAIRQISPEGNVTTVSGGLGAGTTDGTAAVAKHSNPYRLAIDKQGIMYVTDVNSHTIRKITFTQGATPTNVNVTTFAGLAGASGNVDSATGGAARFNAPHGIATDDAGNVYVSDLSNHMIRQISPQGVVSTLAGSTVGSNTNSIGSLVKFNQPAQCYCAPDGNMYIGERGNHVIRKLSFKPNYAVQTFATTGVALNYPHGIVQDSKGTYFIVNRGTHQILKMTPDGVISLFVGTGSSGFLDNADGKKAQFNNPFGIVCDDNDNLFVTDLDNQRIRKITPDGVVTTFAGSGTKGNVNDTGIKAAFSSPRHIHRDKAGNLYVSDRDSNVIRKITPNAVVTTLAGIPDNAGYVNGPAASAKFNNPGALYLDQAGNLYVVEYNNNTVRKIAVDGTVSTLTGGNGAGTTDGIPSVAKFNGPFGLTGDDAGNLFVGDTISQTIRMITPDGYTRTITGTKTEGNADNIFGLLGSMSSPSNLLIDQTKTLIAVERNSSIIRKIPVFPGYMW